MPRTIPSLLAAILILTTFHIFAVSSLAQQSRTNPTKLAAQPPLKRRAAPRRPPAGRAADGRIKQAAARDGQQRPRNNAVMQEQKLPQEFEDLLEKWEQVTKGHHRLKADINIIVYNKVFKTEKRGTGELRFEAPDKGSLVQKPADLRKGRPPRKGRDGKPYAVGALGAERWVCTGKEIIQIDDEEKICRAVPIAPNMRGQRINEGPIPFLFGLKADEAKRRYKFYKYKLRRSQPNWFAFTVVPRRQVDLQEYKRATIILDTEKFVPIAIRKVDTTGNQETEYQFVKVDVNPKRRFWDRGPFIKPNLKGYKWVGLGQGEAPPPNGKLPERQRQQQPGRVRIGDGQPPARKPARK